MWIDLTWPNRTAPLTSPEVHSYHRPQFPSPTENSKSTLQISILSRLGFPISAVANLEGSHLVGSKTMAQAVEDWYKQMPIITRSYLTAAVVTTVGCSLEIISPYHLYLNPKLVVQHCEVWRLITNFFYFRKMDLDFLFHMFFLSRYCKLLEENSFRGRTADFFYMLLFGAIVLTGIVFVGGAIPFMSATVSKILFLSNSLTFMMVYVWSKHNPYVHMSFLGLFTFTAAYLPWVLLGFSILIGSSTWVDILGMVAGHAYFFLEDVYPGMTGRRPLKTPSFIKALFTEENVVFAQPGEVRFGAVPQGPHVD